MIFLLSSSDCIKVNGKDISNVSQQEVMQILWNEEEPITLQVSRRRPNHSSQKTSDVSTQTDSECVWGHAQCYKDPSDTTTTSKNIVSLDRGDCFSEFCLQDHYSESSSYLPSMPHDVETTAEWECQALQSLNSKRLLVGECRNSCTINEDEVSDCLTLTENEGDGEKATLPTTCHHDQDSGVGFYTDGSTQPDDHSGQETDAEESCVPKQQHSSQGHDTVYLCDLETFTSDDLSDSSFYSISLKECEKFQQVLEQRCEQYQPVMSTSSESTEQTMCASNVTDTKQEITQGPHDLRMSTTGQNCRQCVTRDVKINKEDTNFQNSSSVVGTPLILKTNLCTKQPLPKLLHADKTANNGTLADLKRNQEACQAYNAGYQKGFHIPNRAYQYQSYMNLVQEKVAVEPLEEQTNLSPWSENTLESKGLKICRVRSQTEKHRPVFKRLQRNQLLKERALRIREERNGTTTDDDARSEIKLGKYWNKSERKKQLHMSKEQRQMKELITQHRLESLKENKGIGDDGQRINIVELSQKKLLKMRNKKVLDNWVTIQELLAHGTKSTGDSAVYSPLLSVTTV